jgi:DNA polymerase-3 subunit gamma/tau
MVDATAVRQIWPELLNQVGKRSKPTLILLHNATVTAVQGNTLVLSMPTEGLARQLGHESRAEVIRTTLRELLAGEWEVRCVAGEAASAGGTTPPGRPTNRPAPLNRPRPTATRPVSPPVPAENAINPNAGRASQPAATTQPTESDIPLPPEPPADDEPPPAPPTEDLNGADISQANISQVDVNQVDVSRADPPAPPASEPDETVNRLLVEQLGARPIQ